MCGISVIIALQGQTYSSKATLNGHFPYGVQGVAIQEDKEATKIAKELDESLEMISHRGPDSRGQWISDDKRIGPHPTK